MAKRYRDGECCGGCGHAGLTLDREGLCHGCWLVTWERREHAEQGDTLAALRPLDDGMEVPLPMAPLGSVAPGPLAPLCAVLWGLTSQVFVPKRPVTRWLF